MGDYLAQRRNETNDRLNELRAALGEAERIAANRACVYATGSFGRIEAGQNSDLDLFIVGRVADGRRALSRLDEICMKAELIETTRRLEI
ncbi:MAG: nucleotidyltransferase domain-containing protein [Labilithrix sp.]|nr:nucleotidyltransferase domain-containing protein [Labilithrix sp.]MBX3216263.1 nucleotidyltransferase domain-containing protein [Labilithrix sp.]